MGYDVIVVGAGPAGLSAALVLGRCRRRVLVCDSGRPRNCDSRALHGFLTRDGTDPSELLQLGREQLAPYRGVDFERREVFAARREGRGFEVDLAGAGSRRGRKLLLATGLVDLLPELPGLREVWGRSAFHCPVCDAWERRDQPLAVWGAGERGARYALELSHWSRDLVYCGSSPPALRRALEDRGIACREGGVARLESAEGRLTRIVMREGPPIERRWLFVSVEHVQRSPLASMLGCSFDDQGGVEVGRYEMASVPGLFVAGDASRDVQLAIVAAGEGATAAVVIHQRLLKEDGVLG